MSAHIDAFPEGRARSGSEGNTRNQDPRSGTNQDTGYEAGQGYGRYKGNVGWWSVGEFLHQGITHQSVGLSLGHADEETWDLSDSLADLYQAVTQRKQKQASMHNNNNNNNNSNSSSNNNTNNNKNHSRSESHGGGRQKESEKADIKRWLQDDTSHGYIRVFASDADTHARLFPCTLSTSAQKICLQLGIPGNSLHVQLSGDVIRRMEPFDCPLAIQNEYLAGLGYSDIGYIQEEGPKEELAFLVRFYAGKPLSDYTYSRNQLSTYAYVRKGKLIHQWVRRLCVISGTRLLIYREKGAEPTVVQLAKGSVEEVPVKGQNLVLKLTSTLQGERSLYMSFVSQEDYNKWLKKIRKATVKLPSKADLSNCHLEFLPETVFINTELQILILRHNALRERPIEEDIYTIGWLDDLPRFTFLRSLNLADNQLSSFPMPLCGIRSLVELNLASNKLEEIPGQIAELINLQVLHLHNNCLSSLPEELSQMKNLAVVVLAFNQFAHVPSVLLQNVYNNFKIDSIIMAGNQISRLPADHLDQMSHIKKIDLRLNSLQLLPTETARFQSLEHVTHVDIRENKVTDLDIRAIRCMEYLNCERNSMRSMQLNGSALKNIYAGHNCLQTISVNPKPEWLVSMDVSHNKLTELPSWLSDCFFLVHLDVSHNHLRALPERLLVDAQRLKIVKANHNRLGALPEIIHTDTLEELHLQHNLIRHLSVDLFLKAHRLRYLNMTRNKLCDLPPPNMNDSFNKLQEMYLSFNHLGNKALNKICCFPRLRVLHLARNKITVMEETDIEKLEQLSELNISSNNLTYLPSSLGRHSKLQVLRANCNLLQELPNFKNSSGLKVLEVSSNHLVNVDMSNLMASQVSLLDISANPSILVKSHDIEAAKKSKRLCMLDMRGQNWSLEDVKSQSDPEDNQLWQTGLSQTSGIRNKLSVTAINKPQFGDRGEALFAIFDGGRNETIAGMLCDVLPTSLSEERSRSKNPESYLKYSILSAHRNLKSHGQKLGASAAVALLHKDEKGQHCLSVANVGDAQIVLCRQRRACLLSRPFVAAQDAEDTKRVVKAGGIITEDGRVSGVTYNTRMLGCSYLYPHVIPEPYVATTSLTQDDTFFIVASQGLWQYVAYEEAIREVKDTPDPVVAAKRLQDLAQGYGSRENISVLVVRLMLVEQEKIRVRELMRVQRKGQKELLKVLGQQENLLQLRDGVPKVDELNGVVIDKSGHAKKHRSSRRHLLDSNNVDGSPVSNRSKATSVPRSSDQDVVDSHRALGENVAFPDVTMHSKVRSSAKNKGRSDGSQSSNNEDKRLYRKKNRASPQSSLEGVMKKRLSEEVKAKELKHTFDGGDSDDSSDDEFSDSRATNWIAEKPRTKSAKKPEEWEALLQQRLTQELVTRELKKVTEKEDEKLLDEGDVPDEGIANWATKPNKRTGLGFVSDGMLSRSITKPNDEAIESLDLAIDVKDIDRLNLEDHENILLSAADSTDTIQSDVIRMIGNSKHSQIMSDENDVEVEDDDSQFHIDDDSYERISPSNDFDISPSESVSSIDVRVHNEVDEIYRLRYNNNQSQGNLKEAMTRFGNSSVGMVVDGDKDFPPRPLSPDSLISQDEFVKPPIDTSNIDRDALLFHQMQMARAQAHAGSTASLDSVQSAPMNASRRDIYPNVRASSHSIEVLVNVGENPATLGSVTRSLHEGKVGWGSKIDSAHSSTDTITSSRVANLDVESERQSVQFDEPSSQQTLSSAPKSASEQSLNGRLKSNHEINRNSQFSMKSDKGVAKTGDVYVVEDGFDSEDVEKQNEDDNDTIVGDDDVGNLEDVEAQLDQIQSASTSTLQNVTFPEKGDDSDSDDSIGNVSLEDGYSAIEFPWIDRKGSISMLNMLESESEDYPDLPFNRNNPLKRVEKSGIMFTRKLSPKPRLKPPSNSKPFLSETTRDSQKDLHNTNNDSVHIGDYEDIDALNTVEDLFRQGKDNHIDSVVSVPFVDESKGDIEDLNPYEDVQYSPTENKHHSIPPSDASDMPTEEDIDALYAKVNKMKMAKIRNDGTETKANMGDTLAETIMPVLIERKNSSDRLRTQQEEGRYKHEPHLSYQQGSPHSSLGHLRGKSMDREEEEILISDTGQISLSSLDSSSNRNSKPGSRKSSPVSSRVFIDPMIAKPSSSGSRSSLYVKPSSFGVVSSSPSSSSNSISPKLSPVASSKCNRNQEILDGVKSNFQPEFSDSSQERQTEHPQSFKHAAEFPSATMSMGTRIYVAPAPSQQHHSSQSQSQAPPLPPKPPFFHSNVAQHSQRHEPHIPYQHQKPSQNSKLNHQHKGPYPALPPRPSMPPYKAKPSQKLSRAPGYPLNPANPSHPSYPVQSFKSATASSSPFSTPNKSSSLLPGHQYPASVAHPNQNKDRNNVGVDDEMDNSVLSAHELYPDAHYPSSAYFPSSSDMTAVTSKLPTQRSIIITYL